MTTRKQVENQFGFFLQVTGNRRAKDNTDIGGMLLDYNPTYGGYVVHQISNEFGAVRTPYGQGRRPASVFCDMLQFAMQVVRELPKA